MLFPSGLKTSDHSRTKSSFRKKWQNGMGMKPFFQDLKKRGSRRRVLAVVTKKRKPSESAVRFFLSHKKGTSCRQIIGFGEKGVLHIARACVSFRKCVIGARVNATFTRRQPWPPVPGETQN